MNIGKLKLEIEQNRKWWKVKLTGTKYNNKLRGHGVCDSVVEKGFIGGRTIERERDLIKPKGDALSYNFTLKCLYF